jgi:hypothetical protein
MREVFSHDRDLMHAIVRLWRSGFVDLGLTPRPVRTTLEGLASISRVAQCQVGRKEKFVTSAQHRSFALSEGEREVLTLADGERSFEDIINLIGGRTRAEVVETLTRLLELGFFLQR